MPVPRNYPPILTNVEWEELTALLNDWDINIKPKTDCEYFLGQSSPRKWWKGIFVDTVNANMYSGTGSLTLQNISPALTNLEMVDAIYGWDSTGSWVPGGLPTGSTPMIFKDTTTSGYSCLMSIRSTENYDNILLAYNNGLLIQKDIAAGGYISANQGAILLGHGLLNSTDPPKILLMHSPTGSAFLPTNCVGGWDTLNIYKLTEEGGQELGNIRVKNIAIELLSGSAGETVHFNCNVYPTGSEIGYTGSKTLGSANFPWHVTDTWHLFTNSITPLSGSEFTVNGDPNFTGSVNFQDRIKTKYVTISGSTSIENIIPALTNMEMVDAIYGWSGSTWFPGGLPTGSTPIIFRDTETSSYSCMMAIRSTENYDNILLSVNNGLLVQKDIAVGGYLSANQGAILLGHGLLNATDPPKILLMHAPSTESGFLPTYCTGGWDTLYLYKITDIGSQELGNFVAANISGSSFSGFTSFDGDLTISGSLNVSGSHIILASGSDSFIGLNDGLTRLFSDTEGILKIQDSSGMAATLHSSNVYVDHLYSLSGGPVSLIYPLGDSGCVAGAGGVTENHFVYISGNNTVNVSTSSTTSLIHGVAYNTASVGNPVLVMTTGRAYVVAGENLSAGDKVTSDNNGQAVKISSSALITTSTGSEHQHACVGTTGIPTGSTTPMIVAGELTIEVSGSHEHTVVGTTGVASGSTSTVITDFTINSSGSHEHTVVGTTGITTGSTTSVIKSLTVESSGAHKHTVVGTTGVASGSTTSVINSLITDSSGAHKHTVVGTTGTPSSGESVISGGSIVEGGAHTHTFSATTGTPSATTTVLTSVSALGSTLSYVGGGTNDATGNNHATIGGYEVSLYTHYHGFAGNVAAVDLAHTHSTGTSDVASGTHTHSVSGTTDSGGSHSHTFNGTGETVASSSHTHYFSEYTGDNTDEGPHIHTLSTGSVSVPDASHVHNFSEYTGNDTDEGPHIHSLSTGSETVPGLNHAHNYAGYTSGPDGSHIHTYTTGSNALVPSTTHVHNYAGYTSGDSGSHSHVISTGSLIDFPDEEHKHNFAFWTWPGESGSGGTGSGHTHTLTGSFTSQSYLVLVGATSGNNAIIWLK